VEVGVIERIVNPIYKWHLADWQYQGADYLSFDNNQLNYFDFRDIFQEQNKIYGNHLSYSLINGELVIRWLNADIKIHDFLEYDSQEIWRIGSAQKNLILTDSGTVMFISQEGIHGLAINLENLGYGSAYLVAIKSKFHQGFPLLLPSFVLL